MLAWLLERARSKWQHYQWLLALYVVRGPESRDPWRRPPC